MGPLGAKWRPKEAKMEARFDKKTVPKIDAEKVSKNHGKRRESADPRRCEADRVVRGRFTSPLPLHWGTLRPNDPKK